MYMYIFFVFFTSQKKTTYFFQKKINQNCMR